MHTRTRTRTRSDFPTCCRTPQWQAAFAFSRHPHFSLLSLPSTVSVYLSLHDYLALSWRLVGGGTRGFGGVLVGGGGLLGEELNIEVARVYDVICVRLHGILFDIIQHGVKVVRALHLALHTKDPVTSHTHPSHTHSHTPPVNRTAPPSPPTTRIFHHHSPSLPLHQCSGPTATICLVYSLASRTPAASYLGHTTPQLHLANFPEFVAVELLVRERNSLSKLRLHLLAKIAVGNVEVERACG